MRKQGDIAASIPNIPGPGIEAARIIPRLAPGGLYGKAIPRLAPGGFYGNAAAFREL